jgi:hypothetical protein
MRLLLQAQLLLVGAYCLEIFSAIGAKKFVHSVYVT